MLAIESFILNTKQSFKTKTINFFERIAIDILEKIGNEVAREAAAEIAHINLMAKQTALKIIMKGLSQDKLLLNFFFYF